ncbi:MAG TPA: sugar transferase [Bacteroidales bacterium]|nr:sugar transferase [Bacteroidales bacterium]
MSKEIQKFYQFSYIFLDIAAALLAPLVLLYLGIDNIFPQIYRDIGILDTMNNSYKVGFMVFQSIFWIALYLFAGTYKNIVRTSRLTLIGKTIATTFVGISVISVVLFLNFIYIYNYLGAHIGLMVYFAIHCVSTCMLRLYLSTHIIRKLNMRQFGFRTLLVGNRQSAIDVFKDIQRQKKSAGNHCVGYSTIDAHDGTLATMGLTCMGSYSEIPKILKKHEIEEAIIAIEPNENQHLPNLLAMLSENGTIIKAIPELQDILFGKVKLSSILGTPLVLVQPASRPYWEQLLKRFGDVVVSATGMIVLAPFMLILALLIKSTSKGPVLFKQERIGKNGKPFIMHKFRSMYQDAEKNGPQLTYENDPRITPLGRFMRKVRMDEIPQLYNILIGNMSLVGPRPERQFFIDQIMEKAPQYKLILKIKPGLTGWGQVKQGYTENIDQMLSRLKFDLLYLSNMSLVIDIKILLHTFLIILQGRGK